MSAYFFKVKILTALIIQTFIVNSDGKLWTHICSICFYIKRNERMNVALVCRVIFPNTLLCRKHSY